MGTNLFGLLGHDESDPQVQAARHDAAEHAALIESLVRARKQRGLTQKDVAARMETTQSVVSNFERIGGNPTLGTIQRYARAVGAKTRHSVVIDGDADPGATSTAAWGAAAPATSNIPAWTSSTATQSWAEAETLPAEPSTLIAGH